LTELTGINDRDFAVIRDLLFEQVGISLTAAKKALVCSRLAKRVQALRLDSYASYFSHLCSGSDPAELQTAIDLLTTNETYFFREPKHFEALAALAEAAPRGATFRVWSAACSSGEEVYTIAMTLAELGRINRAPPWEVRGSDISTRVLDLARAAHYGMERTEGIAPALLKRYCLCGTGPYAGTMLIDPALRAKVEFAQINLIEPLPQLVPFNVIFLRNVLIYFDPPVKRKVVTQLMNALTPDGVLFVGLAETLNGLVEGLVPAGPGAYRLERRR
jgi:chemotaxis protein methyltransferase CheR